jgi:hypothetical protein
MAGWGFKGILYSRAVRNDLCVRGRLKAEAEQDQDPAIQRLKQLKQTQLIA